MDFVFAVAKMAAAAIPDFQNQELCFSFSGNQFFGI